MKIVIGALATLLVASVCAAQPAQAQGSQPYGYQTAPAQPYAPRYGERRNDEPAMDRMFASVALGCTAKPETSASGSIANGTPLSVCAPKGGCAGFKIRKLALAVAKQSGGIAPTPPGVNVRPLMWPGELIKSERSPGCSSRGSLGPIFEDAGPPSSR